jgi:hypothetical protein
LEAQQHKKYAQTTPLDDGVSSLFLPENMELVDLNRLTKPNLIADAIEIYDDLLDYFIEISSMVFVIVGKEDDLDTLIDHQFPKCASDSEHFI